MPKNEICVLNAIPEGTCRFRDIKPGEPFLHDHTSTGRRHAYVKLAGFGTMDFDAVRVLSGDTEIAHFSLAKFKSEDIVLRANVNQSLVLSRA